MCAIELKGRTESLELRILRVLNARLKLTVDEQRYYLNLEKGYEGEVKFDELTAHLNVECYVIKDLLLKVNYTTFQIDTLMVFEDTISPFEIKNFEGDIDFKDGNFYAESGKEIKNALDQLKRSKSLLRQLLHTLAFQYPVDGSVVFVHSEFMLYHAPKDEPIIYPTQLNRFLKKLNQTPSKLTNRCRFLAEKLVSLHQVDLPYQRLRPYTFEECRKGVLCMKCRTLMLRILGQKVVCDKCGCVEGVEEAILRCVEELRLLFPGIKITSSLVYEWCGGIFNKKRISRVLGRNMEAKGVKNWTFYE